MAESKVKPKNKSSFIKNFKSEFNQIVWPNRKQIVNKTLIVIMISIMLTAIIIGFDTVFKFIIGKILSR